MYAEVDVFISNYTLVDPDIYQLWTEGYSCELHHIFIIIIIFVRTSYRNISIFIHNLPNTYLHDY